MQVARARPQDTALVVSVLAALTAAAWAYAVFQADNGPSTEMGRMANGGLTMGMTASLFIATWIAMMAAMMFPTVVPMVAMFATVHSNRRTRGEAYVPTWVFLGGYFVVWAATALPIYLLALAGDKLAARLPGLTEAGPYLGGAILIAAGLYQVTRLKDVCLTQCRSPLGFVLSHWREGYGGAFAMGLKHGLFCLGCCWVLFLIFFPVGMMNVAWMGGLATLIFLEKVTRPGVAIGRLAALLLIIGGSVMIIDRGLLPGL